ncbi:MAG TPA: S8 family serine peptidase [Thermoleophilaceae bacterium]|nr:S8 family serine peptidase [Thermoleophilaceae bacterium]
MSLAVLATAQSPQPDTRRHLLLVPADAEGTAALARTDARVVADYESFSLVEAAGADDERLRRAGAERRDDMRTVETAAGAVDPATERSSLAAKEAPDRRQTLALVQFVGPPKQTWVERLRETGARIVTYQAENAYVVHASGAAVDRVAALQGGHPAVRAVSVLTAADKLEDRSSPSGVFAVTTVTGAPGEAARDEATALAGPAAAAAPLTVGALRTEYRRLSPAEVGELAREPGVVAVEAYAEPELLDERAAQIMAGNLNGAFQPSGDTYLDWLVDPSRIPTEDTFDFAIDVTDEGLDNGAILTAHPDFRQHGTGTTTRVSYTANYTSDSNARDCGGHGTNVASIATGYNTRTSSPEYQDANNFNHGLGVAPFARLGGSKIFECDGDFSSAWTPAGLTAAAYANGARISNNSWGTGNDSSWGDYGARSAAYDQLVRDARPEAGNQEMVEVFAAGNHGDDVPDDPPPGEPEFPNEGYGTISMEGSAKNVITVGASEGVLALEDAPDGCGVTNVQANSARDIINFSSRGPTDDGRLKPDLVAPGTHITGAAPQHSGYLDAPNPHGVCDKFFSGTSWYSVVSGSSQAAPQVAGAAALVRHWYRRTQTNGTVDPSPALTKALLVNTATDLAGGNDGKGTSNMPPGPNSDQGWGRVNLGTTFDSTAREYRDQLPGDLLGTSGETRARSYSVPDPTRPVKVTLAWTDAPGPTSGNPVVNNLDLVVDAGGRTYKGNVFAGALSRTGGTADPRNNVESVYLPAGVVTRLGVTVKGTTVAGDGVPGIGDLTDQDFALVVSNADELAPTPVLSGEAPDLSDANPGGDDDGAIEPGESFALDQRIRNGGDGPATGIDGTMSGSGSLSFTQPASAYPTTAPGASSENVDQYVGQLSGGTCGEDVSATLSLDTDQGTQQVPVVLPTGYPGTPTPQSSSNVPRSIPDDSSAGVASTLSVPNPGLVKDVDVSISRITHGWVGDLSIQITGPDGTTVKLAEHPGGPDNDGNNFVETVFDDEAAANIASGTAPYTGSFRPQNDELSRFDGKQKQGTWTLRVRDLFEGDTGAIVGWGTSTSTATCARNPQTTITAGPAADQFTEDTDATFEFEGTETPGDPPFECSLDGATFTACQTPPGSQTYTGLADGQHTFQVRAISALGHADPSPATRTWAVDTMDPAVSVDDFQATVTDPTPTVTGTAGTLFGDLPTVRVEIRDSGGNVVHTLTPTAQGSTWSATAPQLPDGNYTVHVEQRDQAGHVGTDSAAFRLVGDFVAPLVDITSPANGSATADTTPTIAGSAGVAVGDDPTVTVQIVDGAGATVYAASIPRDPGSGAFAVEPPQPLALGAYGVRVSQGDSAGNRTEREVAFSVVDAAAPSVSITSPGNGSTTSDSTPLISGVAGTAPGDLPGITVQIRGAGGGLVQESSTTASSGAWSLTARSLADGQFTVVARQSDASGNVGASAPSSFTVDTPDPPPPEAPSFALAPAEERIAEALAGRLKAVAGCASECRIEARLTASARAARILGLGRRSTVLGRGSQRLPGAGTATATVRLTKRAKAALRRKKTASVALHVKLTQGGRTLTLSRTISLRRSAGLRSVASRGLRLWAVCSQRCPLSGTLTLSSRVARRIGLRPRGSARVQVAAGRATAEAGKPTRLTLKVKRGAKKALRKARRVRTLLEAVAGGASEPRRTVSRTITLRR